MVVTCFYSTDVFFYDTINFGMRNQRKVIPTTTNNAKKRRATRKIFFDTMTNVRNLIEKLEVMARLVVLMFQIYRWSALLRRQQVDRNEILIASLLWHAVTDVWWHSALKQKSLKAEWHWHPWCLFLVSFLTFISPGSLSDMFRPTLTISESESELFVPKDSRLGYEVFE